MYDVDTSCISILACSAGSLHAASNPHHHVSATRLLPVHRQEISGSKKPHHYQAIMLHGAGLLDSFRTTNEQYRPPYHGTRGKGTSGFALSLRYSPCAKPSPELGSNGTAMFTTTLATPTCLQGDELMQLRPQMRHTYYRGGEVKRVSVVCAQQHRILIF
ncbi:hypothetical protein BR93DRAFT_589967 [Coniochaeta sp. PMI_546]|nr:hypothetical protein BR93DRAFT_589967 [Coniochaeta sp. PMI_546]